MGKSEAKAVSLDSDSLFLDDLNVVKFSEKPPQKRLLKLPLSRSDKKGPGWPWAVLAVFILMLVWNFVQRSRVESGKNLLTRVVDTITAHPIDSINNNSSHLASVDTLDNAGQQGPKGDKGDQGSVGPQGPTGNDGVAGVIGPQGSAGAQGATGATGATGPQGPSGNATCPNGSCVSLQTSTPGTQETGNINISGTTTASAFNGSGSALTALNASSLSSGTLADARLSTNVTVQGNTFNGASQLVQTTAGGALPALSGANLTSLNGSNISSGTVADARLSSNVTLQGNSFNGASQLVQLNGSSQLPVVSGANLTNLNASNLSSGTVADARLSTNVPLINAANNFSAANTFSAAGTALSVTNNASIGGTLAVTTSLTVGSSGTAITQMRVYTPTLNPASVAAATVAEQTFTVIGLTTSDTVYVNKPSLTANCGIVNVRVSAADTLAITWVNINTVSACDPASEVYRVVAIRS